MVMDRDRVRIAGRWMRTDRVLQVLLAGWFLLLVPRWRPRLIDYTTLDGGWQAVYAHFAFQTVQFGHDLVYASGPFGWLRTGSYWPGLTGLQIAWGVLVAGVLISLSTALINRVHLKQGLGLACLFALIPIIASGRAASMFYVIDLLVLFVFVTAIKPGHDWRHVVAGVYLSLSALVFFPQMVAATVIVLLATVVCLAKFRRLGELAMTFVGSIIVWWLVARQSLWAAPCYLRSSLDITWGYGDVMSLQGSAWEIGVLLLTFLSVLTIIIVSRKRENLLETALLVTGTAFLFFISFKNAAVRYQAHRLVMPALTVYGAALAQLVWLTASQQPRHRKWLIPATTVVGLCLIVNLAFVFLPSGWSPTSLSKVVLFPLDQARGLVELVTQPRKLEAADRHNRQLVRSRFPLPHPSGDTDLFGDRQGIVICHGFEYRPRPVFQRYIAFTPGLARMNGEFLAGETAPHTMIIDLTGFGRILRPQLDPTSFIEILQSYEYRESRGKLAVVERSERRPFRRRTIFEITASPGQWVSTAEHCDSGPIWIEVDARSSLMGELIGAAYKRPPLVIDLGFRDGGTGTFRFAVNAARAGFWLSPTIQNTRQFVDYMNEGFDGIGADRVVSGLQIRESSGRASWAWRDFRIRGFRLVRPEAESAVELSAR